MEWKSDYGVYSSSPTTDLSESLGDLCTVSQTLIQYMFSKLADFESKELADDLERNVSKNHILEPEPAYIIKSGVYKAIKKNGSEISTAVGRQVTLSSHVVRNSLDTLQYVSATD
ncbi:hypothetical protein J6590_001712 [Homalodisca vitripennis]|nr:hypothetical protein J6590_001712 [Homalodisca vitripennis]